MNTQRETPEEWVARRVHFDTSSLGLTPEKEQELQDAFFRKAVEKVTFPHERANRNQPRTGKNWVPPKAPAGYEGLIPQNDADWARFARIMFPKQKNPQSHVGTWKKRIYDSPGWLERWEQLNPSGWAEWKKEQSK